MTEPKSKEIWLAIPGYEGFYEASSDKARAAQISAFLKSGGKVQTTPAGVGSEYKSNPLRPSKPIKRKTEKQA